MKIEIPNKVWKGALMGVGALSVLQNNMPNGVTVASSGSTCEFFDFLLTRAGVGEAVTCDHFARNAPTGNNPPATEGGAGGGRINNGLNVLPTAPMPPDASSLPDQQKFMSFKIDQALVNQAAAEGAEKYVAWL